jgi:uncharacterized protein (TIGR02453 family)
MIYFTNEFFKFFNELEFNNNTTWFNANRLAYENNVKKPFVALTEEMISRINKHDKNINLKASDCIFRINKDVRFSKEKIPYKVHVSANISRMGRKSHEFPGFYYQLSPDKMIVAGGAYMLEKEALYSIRSYILKHNKEFESIINEPDFKSKMSEIKGEKNKIIPSEFKSFALTQPLIANKSFYFWVELDSKEILSPNLEDILMNYYITGKPLNDFLTKAMKA